VCALHVSGSSRRNSGIARFRVGKHQHVVVIPPNKAFCAAAAAAAAVLLQVPALYGLSVLELCMLVAAQRLEDRGTAVFNFEVKPHHQQSSTRSLSPFQAYYQMASAKLLILLQQSCMSLYAVAVRQWALLRCPVACRAVCTTSRRARR
jgi:hypothetical protein